MDLRAIFEVPKIGPRSWMPGRRSWSHALAAFALGVLTLLSTTGSALAETPAVKAQNWADSDGIVVIQRLPYERSGRWMVVPFAGVIPNDPFVVYLPVGLRLGYFLNESFHMELSGVYLDRLVVDRDLRARVSEQSSVTLMDNPVARTQLNASWTLLSAKARTPEGKLVYLRGHVLGGFGAVLSRDPEGALEPRAEGLFGIGFETHTGGSTSLRAEMRQMVFQRKQGGALLPTEFSVGLVWYLGGSLEGVR